MNLNNSPDLLFNNWYESIWRESIPFTDKNLLSATDLYLFGTCFGLVRMAVYVRKCLSITI